MVEGDRLFIFVSVGLDQNYGGNGRQSGHALPMYRPVDWEADFLDQFIPFQYDACKGEGATVALETS